MTRLWYPGGGDAVRRRAAARRWGFTCLLGLAGPVGAWFVPDVASGWFPKGRRGWSLPLDGVAPAPVSVGASPFL